MEVAIKIVDKTKPKNKNFIDSFRRECSMLEPLNHPNILKIYDYGEDEKFLYCIMPLYGQDLDNFVFSENESLPDELVFRIFKQLLDGVEYLHENDIIHRDLKLENILISNVETMEIVIIDFGFAATQK